MKKTFTIPSIALLSVMLFDTSSGRALVPEATPSDLMLAHRCADHEACLFTWTLAARLGHAIARAEEIFGPRDPSIVPLGVEFTSGPNPMVWYPHFNNDTKFVIIQLTDEAAGDEAKALFQLSHEVLHVITQPDLDGGATMLEEGLATWFSLLYTRENGFPLDRAYIGARSYQNAYDLIEMVRAADPNFATKMGRLGREKGGFSRIGNRDLLNTFPKLPPEVAKRLTQRFR